MKTRILLLSSCFASLIAGKAQAPGLEWAHATIASPIYQESAVYGQSMMIDAHGDVYTCGYFMGAVDLDPGAGVAAFNAPPNTHSGYMTKLDRTGKFVWAKEWPGIVMLDRVVIDREGDVVIAGRFRGTVDFNTSPDASFTMTSTLPGPALVSPCTDVFFMKLDASGNFKWAKQLCGLQIERCGYITTDSKNNIYASGFHQDNTDFDPGPGECFYRGFEGYGAFIMKLNKDGDFAWAREFKGDGIYASPYGMAVDESENVYLTGAFSGVFDFDLSAGVFNLASPGNGIYYAFVMKLDAAGLFGWAFAISGQSNGISLRLGDAGDLFLNGGYTDTIDIDPDPSKEKLLEGHYTGCTYLARYTTAGALVWGKSLGKTENDVIQARDMVVGENGNLYLTGGFKGTLNLTLGSGDINMIAKATDAFIIKVEPDGDLQWAKSYGGAGLMDAASQIAVDALGNIYTIGWIYGSADMNPGKGVYNLGSSVDSIPSFYTQKLNVAITSINEQIISDKLDVYPNPANDMISLKYSGAETTLDIVIYNSLGELVYHSVSAENTCLIDLKSMSAGLYTLVVTNGREQVGSKKIVKL